MGMAEHIVPEKFGLDRKNFGRTRDSTLSRAGCGEASVQLCAFKKTRNSPSSGTLATVLCISHEQ